MAETRILGPDGRPIRRTALTGEEGGPTLTGVRQVIADHPEEGLTPARLASLLREAEEGDPKAQMELAEAVEEKYLHYQGVLGTRKRAVARLPVTVEAYSDDPDDVADADLVRDWLGRDTLRGELMDVLDAIGKGISFTEIVWDTSEGQWWPAALKWRPPAWFGFDRRDQETPLLRGEGGQWQALTPYKWIVHRAQAKSGTPVRGGLIRGVAWVYLFQNFGWKSWLTFADRFGMPFRLGKYGPGASESDKTALLRAVRALSSDFGGIIPESMAIELIQAQATGNVTVFRDLVNEVDVRVSIAVLGQNLTTRVEGGSYAASATHNDVREDIRDADADDLAVTLNRDLVRPLIDLNRGPRPRGRYPRLVIAEPDAVDMKELRENLRTFVPMGLTVGMSTIRDKLGLPDPDPDEAVLRPPGGGAPDAAPDAAVEGAFNGSGAPQGAKGVSTPPSEGEAHQRAGKPPSPKEAHAARPGDAPPDAIEALTEDEVGARWEALVSPVVLRIEALAAEAQSAEEFLARLPELAADLPTETLADSLARSLFAARLAGETEADIGNGPAGGNSDADG